MSAEGQLAVGDRVRILTSFDPDLVGVEATVVGSTPEAGGVIILTAGGVRWYWMVEWLEKVEA